VNAADPVAEVFAADAADLDLLQLQPGGVATRVLRNAILVDFLLGTAISMI
jgi:hypothetical protein